jgi:hypothetical protein
MSAPKLAELPRLVRMYEAAEEAWKDAARKWYRLLRGQTANVPGDNVLTAQARMRMLAAAWAAADEDLARAIDPMIENAIGGSAIDRVREIMAEAAPVATSTNPAPECRCYSIRNSAGELESCIATDCLQHSLSLPGSTWPAERK